MTNLTKKISKALDEADTVVVMTQEIDDALDFIVNGPGRWMVARNPAYWEDLPIALGIAKGQIRSGFKAGVVDHFLGELNNVVGIGFPGKVMFCNGVNVPIFHDTIVIKPRPLVFPHFTISSHYAPLRAITEVKEDLLLRFRSQKDYNNAHDQLLMQNIDHGLHTAGDLKYPLLYRPGVFPKGKSAILYGFMGINELMLYHEFDRVALCEDMNTHLSINMASLEKIMAVFHDAPESVLSEDYIAAKTWKRKESVAKAMKFLERACCVKPCYMDSGVIQIHKKGPGPANDPLYHLIPEGSVAVHRLAAHLKVARVDLFEFLKKYEGEHLIFSYAVRPNDRFFRYMNDISEEAYERTMKYFYDDFEFLTSLSSEGATFLNRMIDEKIAAHATENGVRCYIGDDVVGPLEKFVIPT